MPPAPRRAAPAVGSGTVLGSRLLWFRLRRRGLFLFWQLGLVSLEPLLQDGDGGAEVVAEGR